MLSHDVSKSIADTHAVVVQALIGCGWLIGSAIYPECLSVRQVFKGSKSIPMLADCHTERKAGMKKRRAAKTRQRGCRRQTAIVDGASSEWFEKQLFCNR